MRKLIFQLLAVLTLLSCKEKDDFFSIYSGKVTAVKNGEEWENLYIRSAPFPLDGNGFGIVVDRYNEYRFHRETLYLYKINFEKGSYAIDTFNTQIDTFRVGGYYGTSTDDGDVGCDNYNVLTGAGIENRVTVDSYNEKTRVVEGTFDVTFIRDDRYICDPNAPDTIRFTNGWFKTKIKKVEE